MVDDYIELPREIIDNNQSITLCMDIMFINQLAMLTAVDALCAEPGVDFSVTSGTLVWESGQINGYNIVDGDDVVSSGWRQLTGIKILENQGLQAFEEMEPAIQAAVEAAKGVN